MNIVTGVFESVTKAENAIRALLDARFNDDDIGVVTQDREKGAVIADDLGREYTSAATPRQGTITNRSDVYDRMPTTFTEALMRSKLPQDTTRVYQDHLNRGEILVLVNAGTRTDDAVRILRDHDALLDRPERPEAYTETTAMRETARTEGEVHVPVIDEEITVEKTRRQVGEVSVSSETSMETVDIPTSITHEEIRVERRKLDRPLNLDEYKSTATVAEQGVIRMPIVEEEVRVVKSPVIREEIIITRLPVTEQRTVHETVMHTEPHVDTTGNVNLTEEERKKRPAA